MSRDSELVKKWRANEVERRRLLSAINRRALVVVCRAVKRHGVRGLARAIGRSPAYVSQASRGEEKVSPGFFCDVVDLSEVKNESCKAD